MLAFEGPDGDGFALVETEDARAPWTGNGVAEDIAIRGFPFGGPCGCGMQGATASF